MKRIISPQGLIYVIYCPECKCVFEYEQEDVEFRRQTMEDLVSCPSCHKYLEHKYCNIKR